MTLGGLKQVGAVADSASAPHAVAALRVILIIWWQVEVSGYVNDSPVRVVRLGEGARVIDLGKGLQVVEQEWIAHEIRTFLQLD